MHSITRTNFNAYNIPTIITATVQDENLRTPSNLYVIYNHFIVVQCEPTSLFSLNSLFFYQLLLLNNKLMHHALPSNLQNTSTAYNIFDVFITRVQIS